MRLPWKFITVSTIFCVLCLMLVLLLYFIGFSKPLEWDDNDYADLKNKLNEDYTIDSQLRCCYNKNIPINARIGLDNTNIYLEPFIIFCVIGGIILFGWFAYNIYLVQKRRLIIMYKYSIGLDLIDEFLKKLNN
ncbi:putative ORFan [Tupanvirus deep ocean]|uniref:ORFan n=2 Tax=Tupanvirus TaxID=2094720 RepID=A0AC62A7F5_9VIRU|nr:putative ORFan [Tupanvirus deep ocean]QKU33704.1 putative ORFan [Tupanvirus deep ocean]